MRSGSTTRDSNAAKRDRVEKALVKRQNWSESNRDLGERLGVDEKMVRKYRDHLGVPKLIPGSGTTAKKRKYRVVKR